MARREVDDLVDALEASDEGARLLAEGRYGQVQGDRPGMVERVFTRARSRWQPHLHGWGCVRCGPSVHSRRAAHRHDWWHRWLDAMFAAVGSDVDQLEGELGELRAELAEVERAAAAAAVQAAALREMFAPAVARLLEDGERVIEP
ncbi:MAG TPA: hypothetical protein VGR98_21020 [Streptosporangiaceae bacterium]|nr:hypothetical protein [Streptosporangiaceae bacterium]